MDTSFKIRKFEFSKDQPALRLSEEQKMDFIRYKHLQIELLEMEHVGNPSEFVVIVTSEGYQKEVQPIFIYQRRMSFLYQDGRYLLETKFLPEFKIPIGGHIINIQIVAPENETGYRVRMYYKTQA